MPLFEVLYRHEDDESLKAIKLQIINDAYNKGFRFGYLNVLFKNDLILKDEQSIWAEKILNDYINQRQKTTNHIVLVQCLNKLKNQSLKQALSAKILQQKEFWKLPHQLIITALNKVEGSIAKEKSGEILQQKEFWKLPHQLISTALKNADEYHAQKISLTFLESMDWDTVNYQLLSTFIFKANDQTQALKVLSDIDKYEPSLIHNALYSFQDTNIPTEVHKCINGIIIGYGVGDKRPNSRISLIYTNLMKLPFHKNHKWKDSNYKNIRNWRKRQRIIVTNCILANRAYPNDIRNMCFEILENCESEITKRVFVPFKKPNFGNHVMLSLGHPDLREEALKAAIKLSQMSLDLLPSFMKENIIAIVEKGEYPEWFTEP